MSFGIAGIFKTAEQKNVRQMLDKISHRGQLGPEIIETNNATIGIIYSAIESDLIKYLKDNKFPDNLFPVQIKNNNLILERDALGKTPMYYGLTDDNIFCFGSEVKSLLVKTCNVYEFPPGYSYENNNFIQKHIYQKQPAKIQDAQIIADELRQLLSNTIKSQIKNNIAGAWLSGGLDSSAIAGLACKHTKELHTFAIGLSNSPDLRFARIAADYLQSHNQNLYRHHEVIVDMKDILQNLPDAIYHLESFDALLVRSSVTNYIISKTAAEFVSEVFSGEGGDELFAGYSYLKTLNPLFLEDELIDITVSYTHLTLPTIYSV